MYVDVEDHYRKYTQMIIEQGKIIWLIQTIDRKFNIFLEKAFDIAHLTEYMISILWQRIINAISQDRIQDPELFIELFSSIINQDDVWNMMSVEQYFKLREYGKWNESLNELYRSIHGNNMLKFIKEELTIKQIQSAFDNFVM